MKRKILLTVLTSLMLSALIAFTACTGAPSTPKPEASELGSEISVENSISDGEISSELQENSSNEDVSVKDSSIDDDDSTVDSSVNEDDPTKQGIMFTAIPKHNYLVGEDMENIYICDIATNVEYNYFEHSDLITVEGFSTKEPGVFTATVTFGSYQISFSYSVSEREQPDPVCNHTAEGLTPVGSEEVFCGWVEFYAHYYCEVCEKYFYYDETSITLFVECGDCNGDKQDGHTCFNCQKLVRELCSHCTYCLTCCECNFEDLTTYCPECTAEVSYNEGFAPSCDHPGFYDTYQCNSCNITYRIEGSTYIKLENGYAEIAPLGHRTENGVPACLNCGYLYSDSVCVGCLKSEYGSGTCCFDYFSTAFIMPTEYTAQLRTQIDSVWVRLDLYYDEDRNYASLDYKLKYQDDYVYTEIATITASARRITNYVIEFVPTSATVWYRNHTDGSMDLYGTELQIDTTKISYFSIENSYQYWEDGSNEGASSRLFAYMNFPFEICEDCRGIASLGGHGVCSEAGCGKSLCAGHVHGECDHENIEEYYESYCGMAMHYKCNDCNQILFASYNGSGEYLAVCAECLRLKEEMGGSDGKDDEYGDGSEGDDGYGDGSEGGEGGFGGEGGMGINVVLNGNEIFVPYFNFVDLIYEYYGDVSNVKYIVYNGMLIENVEEALYVTMCDGDVIEIY